MKGMILSICKRWHTLFLLLFFIAVDGSQAEAGPQKRIKVMFYNLHNLFDTVDDPDTYDGSFTPEGSQRWTERVLQDKIDNIVEIIRQSDADIVGFSEVENQAVMNRLYKSGLNRLGYRKDAVYAGPSDDQRGIRNAFISKLPVSETSRGKEIRSHRVWKKSWCAKVCVRQPVTRDILEVTFDTGLRDRSASKITVLINHWPSRINEEVSSKRRLDVARELGKITKKIVNRVPGRRVIAMGDFNDDVYDNSFQKGLLLVDTQSELEEYIAGAYYPISYEMENATEKERGTYYYKAESVWNSIDHFLVAGGDALNGKRVRGFYYVKGTFKIFRHKFSKNRTYPIGCQMSSEESRNGPWRRTCSKGASDHWPIIAEFEYR